MQGVGVGMLHDLHERGFIDEGSSLDGGGVEAGFVDVDCLVMLIIRFQIDIAIDNRTRKRRWHDMIDNFFVIRQS